VPPTLGKGWVAPVSRSCQLDSLRKRDGRFNGGVTLLEKGTLLLHNQREGDCGYSLP